MPVMRPSSLARNGGGGSRGPSPQRKGPKTPTSPAGRKPSPTKVRRSPAQSPQRARGGSGPSSPVKPTNNTNNARTALTSSQGSEAGSIDLSEIGSEPGTPEDNINVVVRVRPLNKKEIDEGQEIAVEFPGNGQLVCAAIPGGPAGGAQKPRLFSYNAVFEPGATQSDVLEYSGIKRLLEMAVQGFSCTCFCYGQTGSGKTHTLTGPPGLFVKQIDPTSEDHGLVFRSFVYLFKLIKEQNDSSFVLRASFLEIYNEKVIDLLNPGNSRKPLAVRWSKKTRGFFVENLFTVECEELDDLLAVLEEGMRHRSVGSHRMNATSSRSHSVLTVHILSEQAAENGVFISKHGKVHFVDLAGSEVTKKTHSEGKTLEEANNINKSLMVLGYCISSLSDPKRRHGHIPYRDSKLTKLLADSLAGNGVTLMIACISPASSNLFETINTLRYAARAKRIRTKPIVVMDPREALIVSLKREVNALQAENEHLRSALNHKNEIMGRSSPLSAGPPPESPDLEQLSALDGAELARLVGLYMAENHALRKENQELHSTREQIVRDQELVCRENERLLKKLEDVNTVCCRSPIIQARSTYSAEILNNGSAHEDTSEDNLLNGRVSVKPEILSRIDFKPIDRPATGPSQPVEKNGARRDSWKSLSHNSLLE
ncbi:kinesin-like protein KIF12 [Ctenocephalides felis]|uniref:kinesin-like protein KIF12 n=1 Tax=Ctenocephalides felis TaxID=7515 RepID=UPI000E6E2645|nr:kinesin-like protein KIF12 [Ctenocephalides felis]